MPTLEDLKGYAERATGLRRPGKRKAMDLARVRKPHKVRFKDDGGLVPNHPRWPLIIYRNAVEFYDRQDPAAVIEDLAQLPPKVDELVFQKPMQIVPSAQALVVK